MMAATPNIYPIRNWILLRMFEGDDISTGGIIVPGSFREESNKGEVVAVGDGTRQFPMRFKNGDVVFRVKGHGIPVEENGITYYMMDQGTILATA